MSQTFKPQSDTIFHLFINELSKSTPLWSSIDEGLTVHVDADFIEIDPAVGDFGNNVVIGVFANFGSSLPTFNKNKIAKIQAKIRINTNGFDISVNAILFDRNFAKLIAVKRTTINTSSFTDFIIDLTLNSTDIDDWDLSDSNIHISLSNAETSTNPSDMTGMKVSVFEIEVITLNDCIIERLPQADGEFFTPSTWENELNVNHLLWESVATSEDSEFVKALDTNASGDILLEFQGVGQIPQSGLFRLRARNNGVDDSALDEISLYDNLTHSIVGSGHFARRVKDTSFELSGDYHTYETPITFLQAGFNPSSLYTVGIEISATGVLGIADTEISTQQLTLFMQNSYCCLSPGEETNTVIVQPVQITNMDIDEHNNILFTTFPGDVSANHFQFIDDGIGDPMADDTFASMKSSVGTPSFTVTPMTPDFNFYVQMPSFIRRPDIITVKFRISITNSNEFANPAQDNIRVTLTDNFITGDIAGSNPNHIVEQSNHLSGTNLDSDFKEYTFNFDISSMSQAQYNSFNNNPLLGFVTWNGTGQSDLLGNLDISVVEISFVDTNSIRTCTQFSYPNKDLPDLTDGVWEDNVDNIFNNKWAVINEGVSTANDDVHITFPTKIGQTHFPRIGFDVDQITLDPTSIKLNFRGGGIEPSGSVAHTMTFVALYDTNDVIIATNGDFPIASLSGDMRSYTVDMNIVQSNRNIWDLTHPSLEMKFFINPEWADIQDLRFSALEIESCGVCAPRDTDKITLVLENLDDCSPENILRPNVDIDILPSEEWTLCNEVVDNCLKTTSQFPEIGIQKCPGINPHFSPESLSSEELQWTRTDNIKDSVGGSAQTGKLYTVSQNNTEFITSCTLIGRGFNFANILPSDVDTITGLKVIMKRRGRVYENLPAAELTYGSDDYILIEHGIYLLDSNSIPISDNKANTHNEPLSEIKVITPSKLDPNAKFTHWPDVTGLTEGIVTYGITCGDSNTNDNYWGVENGITPELVSNSFSVGLELISIMNIQTMTGGIDLNLFSRSIYAEVYYFKVELSYTTIGGGGGTVESVAWPCVDEDVNDVTDIVNIKMREVSQNRPTTIYWTEYGQGGVDIHDVPQAFGMSIRQSNMTGGDLITILDSTQVESPDNLVVDWVHDYLYFTESGSTVMQRCELDGANLTPICDLTGLVVEDTFIDFDEKRLYFSTANNGTIEYLNLPNGGFPQNWATGFNHPTGLWKYQGIMYVTDAADGALYSTTGGASKTLVVDGLGTPSGIVGDICRGVAYISDWETDGTIQRMSFANPVPEIIVNGLHIHGIDLDARNGLLYYTESGSLKRVQVDGNNPVVLLSNLDIPRKVNIDTAAEETHTSTLRFGLTDLSRCCLGPTSGYVSVKGAELSKPSSIESFAYIKAKVINPNGDIFWTGRDNPGKIEDNNGVIQIETIGFNNQATNPDFANRADWSDAILQLDIEQFLRPIQPTGFGCPQLDPAFDLYAAQFHVTACSGIEDSKAITLFIDGSGDLAEVMTLYTHSGFINNNTDLVVINNALAFNDNTLLFVEAKGQFLNNLDPSETPLFLQVPEGLDSIIGDSFFTMYLTSFVEESGNMILFIEGGDPALDNYNLNLFLDVHTALSTKTTTLYTQSEIPLNKNMDLYTSSFTENSGDMILFLEGGGFDVSNSNLNLSLQNTDAEGIKTATLIVSGPINFNKVTSLYTTSSIDSSGNMNLFIDAQDGNKTTTLFIENTFNSENMNLVLLGPDGNFDSSNHTLIVHGATISGQFAATTLFIPAEFNDNMNLFTKGPGFTELTSNMNLVLIGKKNFGQIPLFMSQNDEGINDNKTLFIDGPPTASHSGNINLFMARENDSIAHFGTILFVATTTPDSGDTTMFIEGGQDTTNNITLFHKGAPIPSSDFQELYIHGY